MSSALFLLILGWVSVVYVVVVYAFKAIRIARMPIHLRWELYPVPHEKGRDYGGSYFEEVEWWTKPRSKSLIGELVYMAKEILFFGEYYHRNRGFWYFVYPFHISGYLFVAWLALLVVGALTLVVGGPVAADSANLWGQAVYYLTLVVGLASFVIGALSCAALLLKRATDEDLKPYTAPVDYFNLLFVLAVFGSGFLAWLASDLTFANARDYIKSLIAFRPAANLDPPLTLQIILVCLFAIYMPFTRMMHYLAKYFTFHDIRWQDDPNLRGSELEKKVQSLLNQPVTWSAPHIQSGKKWSENATEVKFPEGAEAKK